MYDGSVNPWSDGFILNWTTPDTFDMDHMIGKVIEDIDFHLSTSGFTIEGMNPIIKFYNDAYGGVCSRVQLLDYITVDRLMYRVRMLGNNV